MRDTVSRLRWLRGQIVSTIVRNGRAGEWPKIRSQPSFSASRCVADRRDRSLGVASVRRPEHTRVLQDADGVRLHVRDPAHWNTCFNGKGVAVPPKDILGVEWLDL